MTDEPIIKKRPRRSARSRQQLNLLVFALAMVACITAAALYLLMPDKEGFVLKSYRYTEVSERSFRQLVTAEGTVIPRVTSNLTASAAGTVVQLPVNWTGRKRRRCPRHRLCPRWQTGSSAKSL